MILLNESFFSFSDESLKIINIIAVGSTYATITLFILYRKLLANKPRKIRRKPDGLFGYNSLDLLEFNIKKINIKTTNYQRLFIIIFLYFASFHFNDNFLLFPSLKRAFEILIVVMFLFVFKIKISKK